METEPRGMWVTAGPGKAAGPRTVGNNLKQLTRTVSRSRTELQSRRTSPPSLFAKHKSVHKQQRLWDRLSHGSQSQVPRPQSQEEVGKGPPRQALEEVALTARGPQIPRSTDFLKGAAWNEGPEPTISFRPAYRPATGARHPHWFSAKWRSPSFLKARLIK